MTRHRSLVEKAVLRLRRGLRRRHTIGKFAVELPAGHMLDTLQALFARYDRELPHVAKIMSDKYPGMVVVDVGANVGDTLAALRSVGDFPIVCVEGSPDYLKLLRTNERLIGGHNKIIECFVGTAAGSVHHSSIRNTRGTGQTIDSIASLTSGDRTDEPGHVKVKPLSAILACADECGVPRLLKIDTDGSDFDILAGNADCLAGSSFAVYFEFDPLITATSKFSAAQTITALVSSGRTRHLVYDNFGNFMLSVDQEHARVFAELERFLRSSRRHGGGVVYFDVLALHDADADLFQLLLHRYAALTDGPDP